MINYARQNSEEQPDIAPPPADDYIAPAPRVSVQAFCETVATAVAVRSAGGERRPREAPLPAENGGGGGDDLATVCDPGTRVVVIGTNHDAAPYRELVRRGVSDYVIGPVATLDVV